MLPVTLTQTREERVDIFEIVAELILAQICAYLQVLEDGKVRENSASLGDEELRRVRLSYPGTVPQCSLRSGECHRLWGVRFPIQSGEWSIYPRRLHR